MPDQYETTGGYFAPMPIDTSELGQLRAERDKLNAELEAINTPRADVAQFHKAERERDALQTALRNLVGMVPEAKP